MVVTGASGGLGAALVREILEAGPHLHVLALTGRRSCPVDHDRCHPIAVDFADPQGNWLAELDAAYAGIPNCGLLIGVAHIAGIIHDSLLAQTAAGDWDRVLNVNLSSAFQLCRWAQTHFPDTPPSHLHPRHVVLIGSNSGLYGSAGQAAYSASKAALHGLVKSLAHESGPSGLCVNLVLPGFLETSMTDGLAPAVREKYRQAHKLGRFTTPEESARFIAFLMLGTASISGQVFQLDSRLT